MAQRWTPEALAAVSKLNGASDWPEFHSRFPEYTYDAWESKRRRAGKVAEAVRAKSDEEAAEELIASSLAPAPAFIPSVIPHLGAARPNPEFVGFRTAFLDIEATDLKANFGKLLCVSIADNFSQSRADVVTFRLDDYPGVNKRDDSRLVVAVRDYLETFDHWVTWNGKRYDIPFMDTRLVLKDLRPLRKDIMHTDPLYISRHYLKLHSNRLDAVAKTFRLDDQKTPLDPEIWDAASDLEREAMDYVVEHCEQDVLVLRQAFEVLRPFIRIVHR